ncbi:MAG TPA: hypothetical protein PKC18_03280, partial [Lacipirellulaceae bacterium]|nr:hypothetical protein [Lacipirellulaceae bacterium]
MTPHAHRPLIWLFWIAAACWNGVALLVNQESAWFDAVAGGQVAVASAWLALGHHRWLTRAAWVAAALAASIAPDFLRSHGNAFFPLWRYLLGTYLLLACGTAATMRLWTWLERRTADGPPASRQPWRFPLAELFGWTIVVALAAVGIRSAAFHHVDRHGAVIYLALAAASAGLV